MSGLLSARFAGRRLAWPVGAGFCVTYSLVYRQTPGNFGSHLTSTAASPNRAQDRRSFGSLNPESMRQLSRGSIYGFGVGLLVGFLSHTLALLTGLAMFTIYLAHRYGLDLPQLLGLKKHLNKAILTKPFHNAVFRLSFAATFTLAAFVRF
ncbi:FUN14 family protein [Colletotrichum paranaense]|uniref:FUN14 family protein n=7 Tax=Colletotrichum acutatum species complex TaxID=2707335 RepID=A0A9P9XB33_9PEZI|nr:FUN14 family protein [Colletotrichum lupini]XP_060319350.1 FUN14 family protein [Colletotrichum costaricense]XP_060341792.1 FUN14 family protein [Colletotrichum paranaense]XP_060377359.1 FUN14 family protein [Colletotrichum tamarilloi]XP_060406031.1 FUN14 family protein [Colletotrichum abscissum]KAI3530112.1 FUN14 family protein [Colletotrichum filicis]KAK0375023.1 FUN14 family protein [Colletotrichum limetticola]KAK1484058.1 FUN14 family protein [Colletotrichum cuscutae]KAI3547227.1 FUN